MKRLLLAVLALCALPASVASPQTAVCRTEPVILTVEAADTPAPAEEEPTERPPAAHWDPNWVPADETADETVETLAANGAKPRHRGMKPLSLYAQTFVVTEEDLLLAARVAQLEAGTEERAYRAVLCVIYNRCVARRFGGGITDIATEVYRKHQFSVVGHKRFKTLEPPAEIVAAARDVFVYGNLDLPKDVLFFCSARLGRGFGGRKFYKNIGGNLFFYGSAD